MICVIVSMNFLSILNSQHFVTLETNQQKDDILAKNNNNNNNKIC